MLRPILPRLIPAAAITLALANPVAAMAETAARFPFQVPAELMRHFREEPAELHYALVNLPDGGAAIQTSVRVRDAGPFDDFLLDDSVISILDNRGRVTRRFAVPPLDLKGSNVVESLAGGQLLLMRDVKHFAFFAALALDGAILWQRQFDVGTYSDFPPPIPTAAGGIAFLDEHSHSSSCLLRVLDKYGKTLVPTQLQDPELGWDAEHISGQFLLELSDGGFLAQCIFADRKYSVFRTLLFRIDRSGRELWNRPMRLSILAGREDKSGSIRFLANDYVEQGDVVTPEPPLPGSPFGWLAVRIALENGETLGIERISPSPIHWSGYITHPAGDRLALPDGGMILATRPSQGIVELESLWLTRVDRDGVVIWRRPIIADDYSNDTCKPGCFEATGIAVVNGQVLVAVHGWHLTPGSPRSGIYMVPFE